MKKRIAIFTTDDYIWSFSIWRVTIPRLLKEHEVIGIYLFPDKIGNKKGYQIISWYLKVFGFYTVFVMTLYALKIRFSQFFSSLKTWKALASYYQLNLKRAETPNAASVSQWVRDNNIDIIFIMVGDILKKDILKAPRIGIINKHASLLPSCRGVFPYLWAKIHNLPTGITFHKVDEGIDTGDPLIQVNDIKDVPSKSILRFYMDVYSLFPKLASLAIHRLIHQEFQSPPLLKPSYYGYPTRKDFKLFKKKSYTAARVSDLFYKP